VKAEASIFNISEGLQRLILGVMPPLQSIMKLGPVATTPVKKSQWNVKSKRQDSRHHERVKAKRKAH
jgi:hypothetical protein